MSTKRLWAGVLSIGLLGAAIGCSQGMPTSTDKAPAPDRQVLSVDDPAFLGDKATFEQLRKELPQRISEEDAKNLLVRIDPSQVKEDKTYSVQLWGRYWGYGFSPFYRGLYSSLYYYPYRSYYFPYSYYGGAYYPYSSLYYGASYYPYFYRYRSLYSPYYYWY